MVNDNDSEQVNNELSQDDKMEKIEDRSSIEQIKRKYKDLYGIDVKVEYNEENNVYLIETKNNEIVFATDSLDKELDRLNSIQTNKASSGSGGGYLKPPPIETRRQERALNAKEVQICLDYSSIINVINNLDAMAAIPLNCDLSYANCLAGELRSYYDGLGDNTKEAITSLANSIEGLSGATVNSVKLCEENADKDLKDLEDLINDFYNSTDEKTFEELILLSAFNNETELSKDVILDIVNKDENLTDDDKKYIQEQLNKGNVRSSICHLITLHEQQNLQKIHEKNDPEITRLEAEIADLNKKLAVIDEPTNAKRIYPDGTDYGALYKEREEKKAQLQRLNREITQQERVVRQYVNSRKEWEYDYLLKQVGEEEFEKTISLNEDVDFYKEALKQYYDNYNETANSYLDFESFYAWTDSWLDSDDCKLTIEQKEIYKNKLKSRDMYYNDQDAWNFYMAAKGLANSGFRNENFISTYNEQGFNLRYNPLLDKATKYFDDEHIKLYNYIYNKEGKEAANKYLSAFSDSLNKASGMERAMDIVSGIADGTNTGYVLGLGIADLEGIKIGTEDWFKKIGTIFDETGDFTDSEYAIQYVNQMISGTSMLLTLNESELAKFQGKIDEEVYNDLKDQIRNGKTITYADLKYYQGELNQSEYDVIKDLKNDADILEFANKINDGSSFLGQDKAEWLNTFFNVGVSTGNMLPPMIASFATSGALGSVGVGTDVAAKVGQNVGLSLMFLNSFATNKNQSIRDGRSLFDSCIYGVLSGASDVFTEKFIGFVPGISNVHKWTELTATSKTSNIIMKSLLNFLVTGPMGEITEEQMQRWVLGPAIETLVDGYSDTTFDINEALKLTLETYLSTLQLNSFSIIPQTRGAIKASSEIVKITLDDGRVVTLTAGQLMDCMNKKTGEIDKNKLNQIVEKTSAQKGSSKTTSNGIEALENNLGDEIDHVTSNEDGTFTVTTKYGEKLIVTEEGLNSQNIEYEIRQMNERYEALLVNDWLLNHVENIDSLITNDSERQENIDNYIEKAAKYLGTDSETFKKVYASTFKRIIGESDIGIRVSNDALLQILTSGEIKNGHTTESDRLETSERRKQHEEYLFGIPTGVDGQDSPIYGMIFPKYDESDSQSVQFYKEGPGYWYGKGSGESDYSTEAVIIFKKDDVLDYTTFTNADSLEHGRNPSLLGRYGGIQAPSNANNPVQTNTWFGFDGVKTIEDLENATLYNFSPLDNHDTDGYIEAQIYGRYSHAVDNIDHVVFLKTPSQDVINTLNEKGIKYIISNEHAPVNVQSDSNLYNIDAVPESNIPKRQVAIEKIKNGEELNVGDKLALGGRDHVVREIDGYELKPDHAYRLVDLKAWQSYVESGYVVRDIDEYVEGQNNGGVDWYLGGTASLDGRYANGDDTIILETPADKSLFVLASDNGLGMADDYQVRHIKSSSKENPVPLSKVKVIYGQEAIDRWTQSQIDANTKKLQSLADARGIKVSDFGTIGQQTVASQEDIDKSTAYAKEIREKAKNNEPKVTEILHSLEDASAHLTGLEHKLKEVDSTARKIIFDHNHSGVSLEQAKDNIGDGLRYTMIIDEDHYTEKAQSTLQTLKDQGYRIVNPKNKWNSPVYKGLNCGIISPDGCVFELQFHTDKSFDVKEDKTHLVYEIRRNEYIANADGDLKDVYDASMAIQKLYTSTIPIPKDVIGHDFMKGLE